MELGNNKMSSFFSYNKCTIVVGDVDNEGGGCADVGNLYSIVPKLKLL
jgi:hypothetical protein